MSSIGTFAPSWQLGLYRHARDHVLAPAGCTLTMELSIFWTAWIFRRDATPRVSDRHFIHSPPPRRRDVGHSSGMFAATATGGSTLIFLTLALSSIFSAVSSDLNGLCDWREYYSGQRSNLTEVLNCDQVSLQEERQSDCSFLD
ncbi:hypothetical protein C8R47DRAFT_1088444 [Mycena vitilis]|nr:hypothetical protein C8R47DRAFT_1088444 [Mycena vitilis]